MPNYYHSEPDDVYDPDLMSWNDDDADYERWVEDNLAFADEADSDLDEETL